jgi:transcriptional regulator with XRE-family HTH domain
MSETFGKRLRAARLSSGLSQKEIGKIIGVSQVTVGRWELDIRRRPRGWRLAALARVLRTSELTLLYGAHLPSRRDPVMHMLASGPAFAEFLDARIADLQRQVALARAARASLP